MNKVLFLSEAGPEIGMGHISRCCALADGFEDSGVLSKFFVRGSNSDFPILKGKEVEYAEWFDPSVLKEVASKYRIAIVDSYLATHVELESVANQFEFPIFLIDSTLKYHPSGSVLFPSVYADQFVYIMKEVSHWIAGSEYLLFGKDMWKLPDFVVRKEVKAVGISLGGFAKERILTSMIDSVAKAFPHARIQVFGKSELTENHEQNVLFSGLILKPEYIEQLYKMDIMITGAGLSINECALIGVPVISVILNSTQVRNAQSWKETLGIDFVNLADEDWNNTLSQLLGDLESEQKRLNINKISKHKIDAHGAKRAAKAITEWSKI